MKSVGIFSARVFLALLTVTSAISANAQGRLFTTFTIPNSDSELFTQVDIIDKDLIVQLNPDDTTYTARGILRQGNKEIIGTVSSKNGVILTSFEKLEGAHGLWRLKYDPKETQPDYLLERVRSGVADVKWFNSAFVVQENPDGTVFTAMPTEILGYLEIIGTISKGESVYTAEFKKVEEEAGMWHLEFHRPIYQAVPSRVRPFLNKNTSDAKEPVKKRTKRTSK